MVKKLIVLCWTSEKKNCLLLIRCKKNCRFNMEIEISLVTEKKQPPPGIKWSAPKVSQLYFPIKLK